MSENAPEINACDAMTAASVASTMSGSSNDARRQQVERIAHRRRIAKQQRALAEVVEDQRRKHEREPGQTNRTLAEMPHVGVERLGARDGEDDRTEREEADVPLSTEKSHAVPRIERGRDPRLAHDLDDAQRARWSTNQSAMIGPNTDPTRPVPNRWTVNSAEEDRPREIGTTTRARRGRRHLQALRRRRARRWPA